MDIRGNLKQISKLEKIKTNLIGLSFNADHNIEIPVIMIKNSKSGEFVEYLRGYEQIKNYLKFGYNRIIKKCPFRHRKCIGAKCSLYFVENGTGDCAYIWSLFKR